VRRPATRDFPLLGVVVLLVLATLLFPAPAARAAAYSPSSYAARLLSLVNGTRAQHGLQPLILAAGTGSASWTQHLADVGELSHNPDLANELATHGSSGWDAYGENVAKGWVDRPDAMFNAYMNSPEHRDNILTSQFRYVGVAVVFTGSRAWNTFDFVDVYGTEVATPQRAVGPRPQPKRASGPTAGSSSSKPAPTGAGAGSTHPTRPPRAQNPVQVEGLRHPTGAIEHKSAEPPPQTAAAGLRPVGDLPSPRRLPITAAIAVLVLVASARRWLLEVSRPVA
jgi:hypothetical protein